MIFAQNGTSFRFSTKLIATKSQTPIRYHQVEVCVGTKNFTPALSQQPAGICWKLSYKHRGLVIRIRWSVMPMIKGLVFCSANLIWSMTIGNWFFYAFHKIIFVCFKSYIYYYFSNQSLSLNVVEYCLSLLFIINLNKSNSLWTNLWWITNVRLLRLWLDVGREFLECAYATTIYRPFVECCIPAKPM